MNYSLEQLLSGKKVVCRNGLVPSLIVYFPNSNTYHYRNGIIIIQAPFGAQNIILHNDAFTGRHNYDTMSSDSDYDLLLIDEPSEIPVITISSEKMGFVNLYENDSSPSGLDASFLFNTKSQADAEDCISERTGIGTVFY